ncbi:MAG: hypothetical protein IJX71_05045, partial [Oscillospiraceae bacterium]|nr:hypothetical protein [Oscillospiraceae bacterium]
PGDQGCGVRKVRLLLSEHKTEPPKKVNPCWVVETVKKVFLTVSPSKCKHFDGICSPLQRTDFVPKSARLWAEKNFLPGACPCKKCIKSYFVLRTKLCEAFLTS